MSVRWIIAPLFVALILMTSWALAAKEEPGVAPGAAEESSADQEDEGDSPGDKPAPGTANEERSVPGGFSQLPFGIPWQGIIDELPESIYEGLPVGRASSPGSKPLAAIGAMEDQRADKAVWESSLAAREQALSRVQLTLHREMERSEEILLRAEAKLEEARLIRHYAEKSCGGSLITGGPIKGLLPPTPEELEENLKMVAEIVKKMKPSQAAEMLQSWDEPLIIDVLRRLSARATSPILGKMPANVSGRITSRMLTGEVSMRVGGSPQ